MTMGLLGITGDNITGELTNVTGISFDGGINTLDAYEEGTWTPTLYGSMTTGAPTYTVQGGTYTKIGDFVRATGRITLSSKGGMAGSIRIGGLPFTTENNFNSRGVIVYNKYSDVTLPSGEILGGDMTNNVTYVRILIQKNTSSTSAVQHTQISDTFSITFTLFYTTA